MVLVAVERSLQPCNKGVRGGVINNLVQNNDLMTVLSYGNLVTYIDGCHAVDRINYSLVTPVSRQTQSDSFITWFPFSFHCIWLDPHHFSEESSIRSKSNSTVGKQAKKNTKPYSRDYLCLAEQVIKSVYQIRRKKIQRIICVTQCLAKLKIFCSYFCKTNSLTCFFKQTNKAALKKIDLNARFKLI